MTALHALQALSLRVQVGLEPNKDSLATEGIRFLTTIVTGVHSALFQVCPARNRRQHCRVV